ncbi:MAG: hypothetical protein ABII68_08670 [Pseudomonadota bacterium]|jgi:hypothetical protein
MTKIVDLQAYRTKTVEERGFGYWHRRFGEQYSRQTTLPDLSDRTLYLLALPGEKNAIPFYELIMGVLGIGEPLKFYYLEKEAQMRVMDIHLFLSDQVRFEMMRRLGWLGSYPCEKHRLLEMVRDVDNIKALCKNKLPVLASTHPDFKLYEAAKGMDKEVIIRRLFPKALLAFKEIAGE